MTDGWSTGVLVTELATLYEAFSSGHASPLAPLPLQYADYAAWERDRLQGERLEKELAYWKHALADIPPRLELPTDRPRPAVQTVNGAVYPFDLPAGLAAKLHRLARAEGATLFQVLLAAYQVLLHRYSNQDDICVGTPIANRGRQELEGLIGFFVNTVVLRSDFSDNPSFRVLLDRLKDRALAAQAHQDVPFELLVDSLGAQRQLSTTPVFQVMFTLEPRSATGLRLGDTTITPVETHSGTAKFDMTLLMIEEQAEGGGSTLRGSVEYNTDLWYGSTISRMVGHYRVLLEGIAEDPEQPVDLLPILLPEEERQLLLEWNDTATDYPRERVPARTVRGAGAAARRRAGGHLRPGIAVLCGAQRAGEPARALAAGARRRSRSRSWASTSNAASTWWSRCSASSRREARTCPSTWSTRPSVSRS